MKAGCFLSLLLWAACSYGYWYFSRGRFLPPLDWIVPVAAGLIMTMVLGALRNAFAAARDALRFSSEPGAPGERPRDGEIVTVSGHIRASGSPMHAPLSGRPAVLYSYEISHTTQSRDSVNEANDFSGFGAASAVIDSPHGPIRLLGFPMLTAFGKQSVDYEANAKNVAKYIEETQWTDLAGFHPGAMYHEIKELLTDDDGRLKKDWRMTERWTKEPKGETPQPPEPGEEKDDQDDQTDLDGENFFEEIVAPGDEVSAIGRYSAEKGGLVQDASHPISLMPGNAAVAAGAMWRRVATNVIGALIFGAALNGVLFGLMKVHKPGPPIGTREKVHDASEAMHRAAGAADVAQMEKLVTHAAPVDARDDEGSTPLMRAADLKTAQWLIDHGADVNAANTNGETPLMKQAEFGRADIVKLLVKAGAQLDRTRTDYKVTALQIALDQEKLDVVKILRDAGAKDITINEANGKPIGEDADQVRVIREYLDAVQHEDRQKLSDLSTMGSFKDVDFNLWKKIRFTGGRVVSGFANDNAATVVMRGQVTSGSYVTWTYQLVRKDGIWKLSDERWETRLDSSTP